jgi:hypothetical protein
MRICLHTYFTIFNKLCFYYVILIILRLFYKNSNSQHYKFHVFRDLMNIIVHFSGEFIFLLFFQRVF